MISETEMREWIDSLNRDELIRQLEQRDLSIAGIVPVLRERLWKVTRETCKPDDSGIDTSQKTDDLAGNRGQTSNDLDPNSEIASTDQAIALDPNAASNSPVSVEEQSISVTNSGGDPLNKNFQVESSHQAPPISTVVVTTSQVPHINTVVTTTSQAPSANIATTAISQAPLQVTPSFATVPLYTGTLRKQPNPIVKKITERGDLNLLNQKLDDCRISESVVENRDRRSQTETPLNPDNLGAARAKRRIDPSISESYQKDDRSYDKERNNREHSKYPFYDGDRNLPRSRPENQYPPEERRFKNYNDERYPPYDRHYHQPHSYDPRTHSRDRNHPYQDHTDREYPNPDYTNRDYPNQDYTNRDYPNRDCPNRDYDYPLQTRSYPIRSDRDRVHFVDDPDYYPRNPADPSSTSRRRPQEDSERVYTRRPPDHEFSLDRENQPRQSYINSHRFSSNTASAYETMRKWNIRFSGNSQEDAESFLRRIEEGRSFFPIRGEDLLRVLPFFLSGIALNWFRSSRYQWRSFEEFSHAFRIRFADADFQFELRQEVHRRTQGENEKVADYLTNMWSMLDRIVPPLTEAEEVSYAHRNLLPRLQLTIRRSEVYSRCHLEDLAIAAEKTYRVARSYRPPPTPERSLLPDLAYKENRTRNPTKKREFVNLAIDSDDEECDVDQFFLAQDKKNPDSNKSTTKTNSKKSSAPPKETKVSETLSPVDNKTSNSDSDRKDKPPPKPLTCWNCDLTGHRSIDCKEARVIYCFGCGKKGETRMTCPNCAENANRNR